MSAVELFEFQNQGVRVLVIDGAPWWVLADVCRVLELARGATNVAQRLDADGVRHAYPITDSMGRAQNAILVNESGLYEVIFRSDKPEAAAFRRWVTSEVLPQIRRTGSFNAQPALTDDELIHRALTVSAQRIAELEPKAAFYDELMDADGAYTLLATANMLRWGRNVMMRELRRMGILQGNNLPYARYAHHFKVVPGTRVHPQTGETIPTATTHVLPAGVEFLRKKLADREALAVNA